MPLVAHLNDRHWGLIGAGVIGRILVQRLRSQGLRSERILLCDDDPVRGARARQALNIKVCPLSDACCRADIWLLATPPQAILPTVQRLRPKFHPGHIVISFAAGVPLSQMEAALPEGVAAVRVMPNALSLIGRGVNPVAYGQGCSLEDRALVQELLAALGESIVIRDEQMDWAVGLTGASMRWLLPVLEGMTLAGKDAGFSEGHARWMAAKMMEGVAALALETDMSFEEMKALTSVQVVDEEAIRELFREAVHRAKTLAETMHPGHHS